MQTNKLISFLENSFLKDLLIVPSITDISYNGESINYQHNVYGRRKANISLDFDLVNNFLRQIANMSEKQFSYQSPILDINVGKYRINAVHHSIGKVNNQPSFSFSIRIASTSNHWKEVKIHQSLLLLFQILIKERISIAIGGKTSSGKTEFQKYLISIMSNNTKVVAIDNVIELDSVRNNENIDLTFWQADEKNNAVSLQNLVKNALRNNPDWIVLAETRGEEMLDVLNSAMTGHPIITTLHAKDAKTMKQRMARMAMMSEKKLEYQDVLKDIVEHFPIYVYLGLRTSQKGNIERYISEVLFVDNKGKDYPLYKDLNDRIILYEIPLCFNNVLRLKKDNLSQLKKGWVVTHE